MALLSVNWILVKVKDGCRSTRIVAAQQDLSRRCTTTPGTSKQWIQGIVKQHFKVPKIYTQNFVLK